MEKLRQMVFCLGTPAVALAIAFLPLGGRAQAQVQAQEASNPCGPLYTMHYGPYDYRTQKPKLQIVDMAHFTPVVEALIRGATGDLGKDLDYTLRAAPNHHRALVSVSRWSERLKTEILPGMGYSVSCWFERGIRFAPDDTVTRSLFARWTGRRGDLEQARKQLEIVEKLGEENAITLYNAGQIYFELNIFDRAQDLAVKAREMGFSRPDLENAIRSAGKWRDAEKP